MLRYEICSPRISSATQTRAYTDCTIWSPISPIAFFLSYTPAYFSLSQLLRSRFHFVPHIQTQTHSDAHRMHSLFARELRNVMHGAALLEVINCLSVVDTAGSLKIAPPSKQRPPGLITVVACPSRSACLPKGKNVEESRISSSHARMLSWTF